MQKMIRLFCLVFLGMICGCSTLVHDSKASRQELEREENNLRMLEFAEIRLEIDLEKSGAHNPCFTVIVQNTSTNVSFSDPSEDSFILNMYSPPTYALSGNLVVWRNNERLWDIEPLQMEMFVCGFTAVTPILVRPMTGYLFSFYAHDQFPSNVFPPEASSPETIGEILYFRHILKPPVNPFLLPGRYKVRYEIMLTDYTQEPSLDRRIASNDVVFEVKGD